MVQTNRDANRQEIYQEKDNKGMLLGLGALAAAGVGAAMLLKKGGGMEGLTKALYHNNDAAEAAMTLDLGLKNLPNMKVPQLDVGDTIMPEIKKELQAGDLAHRVEDIKKISKPKPTMEELQSVDNLEIPDFLKRMGNNPEPPAIDSPLAKLINDTSAPPPAAPKHPMEGKTFKDDDGNHIKIINGEEVMIKAATPKTPTFFDYNPDSKTVKTRVYRGGHKDENPDISWWSSDPKMAQSYADQVPNGEGKLFDRTIELPVDDFDGKELKLSKLDPYEMNRSTLKGDKDHKDRAAAGFMGTYDDQATNRYFKYDTNGEDMNGLNFMLGRNVIDGKTAVGVKPTPPAPAPKPEFDMEAWKKQRRADDLKDNAAYNARQQELRSGSVPDSQMSQYEKHNNSRKAYKDYIDNVSENGSPYETMSEEMMPFIHGGNTALIDDFLKGKGGYQTLQDMPHADSGTMSKQGIMVHKNHAGRATTYAQRGNSGYLEGNEGSEGVVMGWIPKKYAYNNWDGDKMTDEFSIPTWHGPHAQGAKIMTPADEGYNNMTEVYRNFVKAGPPGYKTSPSDINPNVKTGQL